MRYDIYTPKYFTPEELVPPEYVTVWYHLCDPRMLLVLDRLRERYGRIAINNYSYGGKVKYAGFRPLGSGLGSPYSQHCFGRAFDPKFIDYEGDREEIVNYLISDCLEVKVIRSYIWGLHIDNRNAITHGPIVWRSE